MFGFGGVFGRKPRQFKYKPLYYDPEKEEREKRRKELLGPDAAGEGESGYVPGSLIRERMGMQRERFGQEEKRRRKKSVLMTAAVLVLLGLTLWLILSI